MLAKRIIPCLDVNHGRVVKGTNFINLKDAGDPVAVAARYDLEGADELVFLDITASHEGRAILLDVVRRTAEVCFMPLTVGGGIRSLDDIRMLLSAGADKVSINSAAVRDPRARAAGRPQVRQPVHRCQHRPQAGQSRWACRCGRYYINGGRLATGLEAVAWAREVERSGAGEIVLTSMDSDGTQNGYDLEMTRAVVESVRNPGRGLGRGAGAPNTCEPCLTRPGPAPHWPRASSILSTTRSARPRNTWQAGAYRCESPT